ncbi:thrombospondin type 3 repeat-containing protein, partial [Candidatus Woesearchaeota archaeon]|nr:thrombospondin type 3 repeat-containing protein [Candidatus Woesearchaeota archaeon]
MNTRPITIFLVVLLCSSVVAVADDDIESFKEKFKEAIKNPQVSKMIGNERINIYVDGNFEGHIITENSEIISIGEDKLDDPTLKVYADSKKIKALAKGEMDFLEALQKGAIKFRGVGFLKSLKFGTANFASKTFSFFRNLFKKKPKIDSDDDGVPDADDNCPSDFNPNQEDTDGNKIGDACELGPPIAADQDDDGVPDADDNCPSDFNPNQEDADGDMVGDACELGPPIAADKDDDGIPDADDNCPSHYNPDQADVDGDMVGDACDTTQPPGDTILEGSLVLNVNQMNQVINVVFTEVNNQANTFQTTITLDGQGQTKDFTEDVGFNINPATSYEVTYEWVSGSKIQIKDAVVEGVKVISAADGIMLGDGTQRTQTSVTVTFTTIGGAISPCGNGVLDYSLGEECDDGNTADGDGCRSDCSLEQCGDGIVDSPAEECDDGNNVDGDGCNFCVLPVCG